jgi:hypothetical protein
VLAGEMMTKIPQNVKEKFFGVLEGSLGIEAFELWIYESKDIETLLPEEDYIELLSINYQRPFALNELCRIFAKHLNSGEFETWQLRDLLVQVSRDNGELASVIASFYDLYCRGYSFLYTLGLDYGLTVKVPPSEYTVDNWHKLRQAEKDAILDSFFPEIEIEVNKVLKWLDEGKIVITGSEARNGYLKFQDYRTEEEKKSTQLNQQSRTAKKWWQFWRKSN